MSLVSTLALCASLAAAMACYAGGSWLHPHAAAHSFFENFWCDLVRDPAHNGRPNALSVRFATFAFAAAALALGAFWLELAQHFSDWRRRFLGAAGVTSAVGTLLVGVVPSDRFPHVHAPAVLIAGGLGFACGCVGTAWSVAMWRREPWLALASCVLVLAAGANLLLYVAHVYFGAPDTIALPAAQKVATMALVVWLILGLRFSANRPKP